MWVKVAKYALINFLIFSFVFGLRGFVGFSARSRMSEAKNHLVNVHVFQSAVFRATGRFSRELANVDIDYSIMRYVFGFSDQCRREPNDILNSLQKVESESQKVESVFEISNLEEVRAYFKKVPCLQEFPDKWEAFAVGRPSDQATLDVWRINEKKEITHMTDNGGLPNEAFATAAKTAVLLSAFAFAVAIWMRGFLAVRRGGGRWFVRLGAAIALTLFSMTLAHLATSAFYWIRSNFG